MSCVVCLENINNCSYEEGYEICSCDTLCTEESINSECEVCKEDYNKCSSEKESILEYEKDDIDGAISAVNNNGDTEEHFESSNNASFFGVDSEGMSADNPIEVPEENMIIKNDIYYGISKTWYDTVNPDKNELYVSVKVPENVKEIAQYGFTDQWSYEKDEIGDVATYYNEGNYTVVSIDFTNAINLQSIKGNVAQGSLINGVIDLSNTKVTDIGI